MAGRVLIIIGAIVAVARGGLQLLAGLPLLGNAQLEAVAPGIGMVVLYEVVMAVLLIGVGVVALVKSGSATAGNLIKMLGFGVVALGTIDLILSMAVVGGAAAASGLGSLLGCALAGGLLIAGGMKRAGASTAQ